MTAAVPSARSSRLNGSFIFIAACAVLFLLCVAFRLNGSSSACWAEDLQTKEPTGLLLGQPRLTRSDEWLVWTPAALSQLRHVPPMPRENHSLGAGLAPLLMSVPVRHYTMFFRPQFGASSSSTRRAASPGSGLRSFSGCSFPFFCSFAPCWAGGFCSPSAVAWR